MYISFVDLFSIVTLNVLDMFSTSKDGMYNSFLSVSCSEMNTYLLFGDNA